MSDNEACIICHFDGELDVSNALPVYNGGEQKVIWIDVNISYNELVEKVIEEIDWEIHNEPLQMQYQYHNGRSFTFITIRCDDDLRRMFKLLRNGSEGIFIYVNRKKEAATSRQQSRSRHHMFKRSKDVVAVDRESRQRGSNGPSIDFNLCHLDPSRCAMSYIAGTNLPTSLEDEASPSRIDDAYRCDVSGIFSTQIDPNKRTTIYDDPFLSAMLEEVHPPSSFGEDIVHLSHERNDIRQEQVVPEEGGVDKGCGEPEEDINNDDEVEQIPNVSRCPPIDDSLVPKDDEIVLDHDEGSLREMWKGRRFLSRESFRTSLRKFSMYKNFELKWVKWSSREFSARCGDLQCPWRIHASIVESGPEFQVRTYSENHTCSKPMMGLAHSQATSKLIADYIKERLRLHPSYTPKEVISDFQLEFGTKISYKKAWKAKEIALLEIRGSYEESFSILPDYCCELERSNPGSVHHLIREDDDSFQRFFWAFGSSIRSFKNSLRPLIAVDGAHLRGKYPGVLFVAVTYDGDHRLFPLAFAIAEIEERKTWEWFFAELDLHVGPFPNLTIVSDRQKGLKRAVRERFPNASHCYCMRHIVSNFKDKFKDEGLVVKFWNAAKAYRPVEYERHMTDIRDLSESALKWIEEIGRQHWASAFVEGRRYDMITTNIAECTNSLLKDVREYPITKQVEAIHSKIMEFYEKRRRISHDMHTRLTPYAEKLLSKETEDARRLGVQPASQYEFQVHSTEYIDVVHLDRRSCSCRKWDVLGIPCSHAIAAIHMRGLNPYDYCEHWFTSDVYRSTYNDIVHATRDISQWGARSGLRVLPPHARRQAGRPRKNRIRTEDRQRRQVKCSNCHQVGHNRQRCRNAPARQ